VGVFLTAGAVRRASVFGFPYRLASAKSAMVFLPPATAMITKAVSRAWRDPTSGCARLDTDSDGSRAPSSGEVTA
jgi:hypothetical protein